MPCRIRRTPAAILSRSILLFALITLSTLDDLIRPATAPAINRSIGINGHYQRTMKTAQGSAKNPPPINFAFNAYSQN
jgi:hypothetical protein